MLLLIDANVIVAAFLKDSITRKLLLHPHFKIFATAYNVEEFLYYKKYIKKKARYTDDQFDKLVTIILPRIKSVPQKFYQSKIGEAKKLIGKIDEKDVPLVALALTMDNEGIWTYDNHFLHIKNKIKIWSTKELSEYMFGK